MRHRRSKYCMVAAVTPPRTTSGQNIELSTWFAKNVRRSWEKLSPLIHGRLVQGIPQREVDVRLVKTKRSLPGKTGSTHTPEDHLRNVASASLPSTSQDHTIAKAVHTRKESVPCAARRSLRQRTTARHPFDFVETKEINTSGTKRPGL